MSLALTELARLHRRMSLLTQQMLLELQFQQEVEAERARHLDTLTALQQRYDTARAELASQLHDLEEPGPAAPELHA
ncbi:MAG TPA: hypothetical protein VGA61_16010 [Anaerolineae bacterium]